MAAIGSRITMRPCSLLILLLAGGFYFNFACCLDDEAQPQLDLLQAGLLEEQDLNEARRASGREEIFLLEDKDYPRSLFEDFSRRVGQVSGISALPSADVVIFHRAERQWNGATQMPLLGEANFSRAELAHELDRLEEQLIKNNTLMVIDGDQGNELWSFGANLFYMPHSVASDAHGNLWVSDSGRHQVMRFPNVGAGVRRNQRRQRQQQQGNATKSDSLKLVLWPDIVLGEAFTQGQDGAHFCQPAEVAPSSDGRLVFVADGYCNNRVMVFTGAGQFVASFGQEHSMRVVHSLALMEARNLLCAADRENARILCFRAGLDGDLESLGELRLKLNYPIGFVYALTPIGPDHLLVSSRQLDSKRYDLAILNPFTRALKLVWTSSDLLEPHSLARTADGQFAYAADVSRDAFKKVFKFNVIARL